MPDLEVTDPQNGRRYTVEWLSQDAPTAADVDAIVLEGRRRHAPTVVKAARKVQEKAANPLLQAFAKPKPEQPYKPRDLAESIFGPPQAQAGDKPEVAQRHKSWQKEQLRRFDEPVRRGVAQIPSTQAEFDPFGRNERYSEKMHGPAVAQNVLGGGRSAYKGLSMIQEGLGSAVGAAARFPERTPLSTMLGDMLAGAVPSTIKGMTPQASPEEQDAALLNVLLMLGVPAIGKAVSAFKADGALRVLDDVLKPRAVAQPRPTTPPFEMPEAPVLAKSPKPKYLTKKQKAAWLDESKSPEGYDAGEAPRLLGMAKKKETTPVAKERWDMTADEYMTWQESLAPGDRFIEWYKYPNSDSHHLAMLKAAKEGKIQTPDHIDRILHDSPSFATLKVLEDQGFVPSAYHEFFRDAIERRFVEVGYKTGPDIPFSTKPIPKGLRSEYPRLFSKSSAPPAPKTPPPSAKPTKPQAAPQGKQPWEMTREERQTEIEAIQSNREIMSTPLMSDGEISATQINRMGRRERERWQTNASAKMDAQARIRNLSKTDEELRRERSAAEARQADLEMAGKKSRLEFLETYEPSGFYGIKGSRKTYQAELDALRAELGTSKPTPAQSLLAASEPKTGGMGRKAGAVQAPAFGLPRAGVLGDVATGAAESVGKAVAGLAGNAFNKLNSMGEAGKKATQTLKQVLSVAGTMQAGWGERLRRSVKSEYAAASVNKRWHALEADLADMYEAGGFDSPTPPKNWNRARYGPYASAKKIADAWTGVNREIASEGVRLDVLTRHFPDDKPNPKLVGEKVFWNENGQAQSGEVASVSKGLVTLVDGRTLKGNRDFYSQSLTIPEHYFPRELKPEVMDQIRRKKGRYYEAASKHLIASGQAADEAAARKMLADVFESYQPGPFGGTPRLERPRLGFMLPKEFYNRNFLEVTENHIARSAKRLAQAEVWGRDQERLSKILDDVGGYDDKLLAAREIERALGEPGGPWNLVSAAEGAYTAVSKMGASPTTVIVQPTQMANTYGKFGAKAFVQGMIRQFSKVKRAEVTVSGVVTQDLLTLLGRDDLTGLLKAVVHLPLKLIGWADRVFRTHAALSGEAYIESAAKNVKIGTNGKPIRNWAARDMMDWFGYTEEDLVRISKTGLSSRDRVLAMDGGSASNVRARPADLPSFTATPWGRILLRLRTFTYGQGQVLGSNLKELKNGNPVPLTRQLVGSLVVGYGVKKAKDAVLTWLDPERQNEIEQKAKKAGWDGLQAELMDALLESGMLGFYGVPAKAVEAKAKYGINIGSGIASETQPVVADTLGKAGAALYDAYRSPDDFIDALKKAGLKFTYEETAAIRRYGKRLGIDKPLGPTKPAESSPSSPSSLESALRSL